MCDPLMLMSFASSAVGGLVNANIQKNTINEQNKQNRIAMDNSRAAREDEDARQKAWELEQSADVNTALAAVAPETRAADAAAAVADPANEFATVADDYNVPTLQGQIEGGSTTEAIGRIVSEKLNATKGMINAASMLTAQGVSAGDAAQAITQMGGNVANISSNRRGSGGVARLETAIPAATVTPSTSVLGDMLMLGGQLGAGIGGKNVGTGTIGRRPWYKSGYGTFGAPLVSGSPLPGVY